MQPKYILNSNTHLVTPVQRADSISLSVDGHLQDVRLHWHDQHRGEIIVSGAPHEFYTAQDDNQLFIHFDGKTWQLEAVDEFGDSAEGGAGSGRVKAPMPGVVIEVNVSEGDQVNEGDALMLIESMKLQTEIKATVTGRIKSVGVEAGISFDKGQLLADIELVDTEQVESKSAD